MDTLTIFGASAVGAMLAFYSLERRGAVLVLAFAGACLASSAYAFLAGTVRNDWQARRTPAY